MKTISIIIFSLWFAAIIARCICVSVIVKRGLFKTYLALSLFLMIGTAKSLWLVGALVTKGNGGYLTAWINAQPLVIALYAVVTIEAFYLLARHFKDIRWFAVAIAVLFTAVSVAICFFSSRLGAPQWPGSAQRLVLLTRYYGTGCMVLLWLSIRFFRLFPIVVMRSNSISHANILIGLFAADALAMALQYATSGSYPWMATAQLLGVGAPIVCYAAWFIKLTPEGESFIAPAPRPSVADLIAEDAQIVRDTGVFTKSAGE